MPRRLLAVGVAAFAAVAGLACRARQAPELVVACPAGPTTLVPNAVNEEFTLSVQSNVYESLIDLTPDLRLRPGLAESWHTPDDLTWVFRLRQNVRLHDDRFLDVRDVVTSLEKARTDPASKRQAQLAAVERIEAADSRTVVFHMRRPFDPLPVRLSNILISGEPRKAGQQAVGTGPYRVRSLSPGGDVTLGAFSEHWGGPPPFRVVEFRVVPDPHERAQQLRAGRVHLVVDAPADEMATMAGVPGLKTVSRDGLRVLFLGMDCARDPFRDIRVRRAVALAVDREALVRGPLGGFAQVVDQIASPEEVAGLHPGASVRRADPDQARRLLAAAGQGSGFDLALDYMPKYRAAAAVAQAIAADLALVGIRVTLRPSQPLNFLARLEKRDLSFYMLGWISDTGDAGLSYEYLIHSRDGAFGLDNGGYSNPEADRVIEEMTSTHSPLVRRAMLLRAGELVAADVPVIPLYRQADLYAMAGGLDFTPRLDRRLRAAHIRWSSGGPPR